MQAQRPIWRRMQEKRAPEQRVSASALKVAAKFAESWQDDQLTRASHDRLVLELPGVLVRDINSVEADFHGRIDVASRTVADHPSVGLDDFMFVYESAVGVGVFLRHDFDEFKEALQARSLDLRGLLGGLTFREQYEAVAFGEIGERFWHAVENFRRGAFEFDDAIVDLRQRFAAHHVLGKLEVGFLQRAAEAPDTIAILANILALRFVEDVADVGARVPAGLDQANEILDELFEKDVVFPQGVVGVD